MDVGAHTLTVFFHAHDATLNQDAYISNLGNNYIANFTVGAGTFTFTGTTNGNINKTTSTNWAGGIAPGNGHNLSFGTSSNTSLTNSLTSARTLVFNNGASSFTLGGSALALVENGGVSPKIENLSSTLQNINVALTLTGNATNKAEIDPINGNLSIGSTISLTGSTQLQVWGNNGNTVTFNGVISGTSSSGFALNQNSNAVFKSANTYSGDTFVNAGKLQFDTGGSANNSTIRIGDISGSANAEVDLIPAAGGLTLSSVIGARAGSSGSATIASQNTSNSNTLSGHLYLEKNLILTQSSGGTLNVTQARSSPSDTFTGTDIKGNTLPSRRRQAARSISVATFTTLLVQAVL